jgi:hypothetical protein
MGVREPRFYFICHLTIARAWVLSGMPPAKGLPSLGGYESYCKVVGGILTFIGVEVFLANLDAMYNETDFWRLGMMF